MFIHIHEVLTLNHTVAMMEQHTAYIVYTTTVSRILTEIKEVSCSRQ